jgi:hypothetical protein
MTISAVVKWSLWYTMTFLPARFPQVPLAEILRSFSIPHKEHITWTEFTVVGATITNNKFRLYFVIIN